MFGNKTTLGFWLDDTGLRAALIRPARKGWKTAGSAFAAQPDLLAKDADAQALRLAFRECLKNLPRLARRADTPAALALPDRLVTEDVLKFDDFPKAKAEAMALVSHRMSRETGDLPGDLDVTWDIVNTDGGQVTCRVRALKKALRQRVETAATSAGLRLVRIDGWLGYASADPQLHKHDAGSALWSDGRDWSLLCWSDADAAGFSQYGRVDDPDATAGDVVRLSLSFARAQGHAAGPLSANVPDALLPALTSAADKAGLEAWALPAIDDRAAQVAAWA